MRMTSSRVLTSASLLALLMATPLAFADQKDDLYKKGQAAVNAGDSIAARDAFCALPADYSNGDAGTQCKTYTDAANRTLTRYKINFGEGNDAMAKGDYATAEAKFHNVKAGEYAEQAKQKLQEIVKLKADKAAADSAAQQNAALEGQMKQRLDQGTGAFNSGDFNTAKSLLGQVAGSRQGEARAILDKIRSYENGISQGNTFMAAKDYLSAKNAYQQAMGINATGPSNASDLFTKAVTAAATASATPSNPVPANNGGVKPPQPKPQIDINAYMGEAQKAFAKKDYKKARRYLGDIFAQDRNNQDATNLLAQVNGVDTAKGNASDEDNTLRDDITLYYTGRFQDAEFALRYYLNSGIGKKKGLASFYLGASLLSRYYISGATDQSLKAEAQSRFKDAKNVDGFKAPEQLISPKILKVFQEAS
jgi:hypothetical protein